jgi:hypothetical protein
VDLATIVYCISTLLVYVVGPAAWLIWLRLALNADAARARWGAETDRATPY